MKQLFVTSLFAIISITISYSQTVNDIPLKDINVEYCQIVGSSKLIGNKVVIEIDFGQKDSYWTAKDTQLKDKDGKLLKFNSMIDALNFMSANGYDFVQAYAFSVDGKNVYHYLLKRKS